MANVKSLEGEISYRAYVYRQREKRTITKDIRGKTSQGYWLDYQIPEYEVGEIVDQCLRNIDQGVTFNLNELVSSGMTPAETREMQREEREAAEKARGHFKYTVEYDMMEIDFLLDDLEVWMVFNFNRHIKNVERIQIECRRFVPWDKPIGLKHVQVAINRLNLNQEYINNDITP